jgi:hypothetical protein
MVDVAVEEYLIESAQEPSINVDEINSMRSTIIEGIENILNEQLISIKEQGKPKLKYCYLFESTESTTLDLKLVVSKLRIPTEGNENNP